MLIKGRSVTLRAPELADVELLNKWSNDPEIWHNLGGWHFPFSSRSTQKWVEARDDGNMKGHVFCIETPDLGLIGTVSLVDIDWKNQNAFYGTMLGDKDVRGKGYALDAGMALFRYAFEELGLNRLDGTVIAYNERALKFITEKCGWKVEGVQRQWYHRGGGFHDRIMVGLTAADYREHCAKTDYWADGKA